MTQKIVFFDIDGTLLHTGGAGQRALGLALVEGFQVDFPFEGVLTAGRTDRGITDEIFQRHGVENSDANRRRFRDAYLAHLPDALSDSPGRLLPCVRELLEQLAGEKHVTLSLLTGNYAEGAWIKLRHFQLDDYFRRDGLNFKHGGFGDDHAERDDVARFALTTASTYVKRRLAGVDTMVIGDTPADIQCARAIDATAVAVATGTYTVDELRPHAPDHVFEDFSDTDHTTQRILELL
ncbi:HAD family hydrolase [Fuerstiella marisgermanici]|uniref:phosphoglycolate phosphatase n=1 Tax=Fuerstiella marisgermanici TaxID=1891926 RepID=A0A1P8WRY2_9PLAN|nr:haloacid dehalogenase-like hydrolase [Fuerstiella marisgermanici]APZ96822.1 phosphoglycolate phosphatase [Fuerstiella marisgermanici]